MQYMKEPNFVQCAYILYQDLFLGKLMNFDLAFM